MKSLKMKKYVIRVNVICKIKFAKNERCKNCRNNKKLNLNELQELLWRFSIISLVNNDFQAF